MAIDHESHFRKVGELASQQVTLCLQLLCRHIIQILAHDGIRNLPNLQQVVLGSRAKHPRIIEVPAEIGDTVGVSTVHEQAKKKESVNPEKKKKIKK